MSDEQTQTASNQITGLINEAKFATDITKKLEKLRIVQELLLQCYPSLVDTFWEHITALQTDFSPEVRKFVLKFVEEAWKKDTTLRLKVIKTIAMMVSDENVKVQKLVIAIMLHIYPAALKWIAQQRTVASDVEQIWDLIVQQKNRISAMTDEENDGIRTYAINFLEQCILAQSCRSAQSEPAPANEMSLDQVPRDHRFISYRRLEADGKSLFQLLLNLIASPHISGANLGTAMAALSNIARQRPEFMERAILAFESLHNNLPPSLSRSQVSSNQKNLINHLIKLAKSPASASYHQLLQKMLVNLDAKPSQISKAFPAGLPVARQRKASVGRDAEEEGSVAAKRARPDRRQSDDEDEDDDHLILPDRRVGAPEPDAEDAQVKKAIDMTADFLCTKLVRQNNVTNLVMASMAELPDVMPAYFLSAYTPIIAAGANAQIQHLSRLMAAQFTAKGVGPGAEHLKSQEVLRSKVKSENGGAHGIPSDEKDHAATSSVSSTAQPGAQIAKRFSKFGLAHITKPMDHEALMRMTMQSYDRLLAAEKRVVNGGASAMHTKILIYMASTFSLPELQNVLEQYIMSDPKGRADIAVLWLYYEYSTFKEFSQAIMKTPDEGYIRYSNLLQRLLSRLYVGGDQEKNLFHKLLLEIPLVTPNALSMLEQACLDPVHGALGLNTLREMILTRPCQRNELLNVLLDFTSYERPDLRHQSLEIAKDLYCNFVVKENVLAYVTSSLRNLLQPVPPELLFGKERGRLDSENRDKWEENSVRACLYLYLHLLPVDHSLIHQLASVYVDTSPDVKRIILKLLETPVKAIGINSPELLTLVERCSKGAGTLVMRIVHILTERNPPTMELVACVRDLYNREVSDVRFLIPILAGLSKNEIFSAIPKFIRLSPIVLKEVFHRLLHGKSLETGQAPLSASELLIALHQVKLPNSDTMKSVIAGISSLLNDRQQFTKDVMASVIQQLIEQQPLPILLMRTVLTTITNYPALIGFIMNMMQRLIIKQVWRQPKVWEGFIRCCQKTRPQSFQILLQLPSQQLKDVLTSCPDLREPFINHLSSLSTDKQAHIPQTVFKALQIAGADVEGSPTPETTEQETQESSVDVA